MPRGLRVIPFGERPIDTERSAPDGDMIFADFDFLPTHCHCDTVAVLVPQKLVHQGQTYSCGRPGCRPAGSDPDEPVVVAQVKWNASDSTPQGLTRAEAVKRYGEDIAPARMQLRAQPMVRRGCAAKTNPTKRTNQGPKGSDPKRPSTWGRTSEVVARRNAVALLWDQGNRLGAIAQRLELAERTVNNDLTFLDSIGRIKRGTGVYRGDVRA